MSSPYPSRRSLRLQRERAERAQLRDAENTGDGNTVPVLPLDPIPQPGDETVADEGPETPAERRRRRVDSAVTSTGMLPIISKPVNGTKRDRRRSRRETRILDAQRAAKRRAEVERLQREQNGMGAKARRRATAPQTTSSPARKPAETEAPPAEQSAAIADHETLNIEMTGLHDLSATEITDMSGLDTIEIRRAELRAETERLTQEIIEHEESNPKVIDPQLLHRQTELAAKSQELQELETAAIELVESENQDADATSTQQAPESSEQSARDTKKPPLAEFIRAPVEPEAARDPREPIEASSAHGLDTLDAKDAEAPDRILRISAIVVFAIGLIALIIAIILLAR